MLRRRLSSSAARREASSKSGAEGEVCEMESAFRLDPGVGVAKEEVGDSTVVDDDG